MLTLAFVKLILINAMIKNHNYCVILAGGLGKRLWPYSRKNKPKQFLDFFGTGRTMLQQTYDRFCKIIPKENIFVCTQEHFKDLVNEQLPEITDKQIVLEPLGRNTAPCVAWVAHRIYSRDKEANMIISPSDQLILNEDEFRKDINMAFTFISNNDCLLTLGIKPTRPDTRYGYIQFEESDNDYHKVKSFTEKPEAEFAKMFVESGEFYWNTGLFMWSANAILKAFSSLIPDIATILDQAETQYNSTDSIRKFVEEHYSSCPNLSIDYGILERASNVYVMHCDFGWADLGSWETYHETSEKDENGNVFKGSRIMHYDCHDNLVMLPDEKLAVIQGLEGYTVIEHNGVLLICKRGEASIRKYVNDVGIEHGEEFV